MAQRLSAQQLEQLWVKAGGPRHLARTMAAIALRESGGDPYATNHNTNGTTDRGLWQVNDVWGPLSKRSLGNPEAAARAAVHVLRTQGLKAWATYNNGSYKQGMASVPASVRSNVGGHASSPVSGGDANKALALSLLGFGNLGGAYPTTDPVALALQATQQRASSPSLRPQQGATPAGKTPSGVANFEGHKVAAWIKPYLVKARQMGWKGQVNSGYRSYADQQRIYNSGVRPAAKPGTSNHEGTQYPRGAVDVSDAAQLAAILRRLRAPLSWAGAKDPVHFSHPHGGSY